MHITAISLSGFKSFAEQTDLPVRDGLTVIVGPNGCGKSNIIEAVRWVMGEASAKRLRGAEMEDVIFAGTPLRRRRQSAEVRITLDNSEGLAPAPFHDAPELMISRRIERGQGSTYRINNAEVRARDVQMLFADLSIGSRSASIISQGEVAALVDSKPDGRRLLLEEAAGVRGLHSRRHESELKLAQAETNLLRLADIIDHGESELLGLEKQARETQRYRELMAKLRGFQALYWWVQDRDLAAEEQVLAEGLSTQRALYQEGVRQGNSQTIALSRAEAEVIAARTADEAAIAALQAARDRLRDLERQHETLQAALKSDQVREGDWAEELARLEQESADWQKRIAHLQTQSAEATQPDQAGLATIEQAYQQLTQQEAALQWRCDQDSEQTATAQRTILQHQARLVEMQRQQQQYMAENTVLAAQRAGLQRRVESLRKAVQDQPAPEQDWQAIRVQREAELQQKYAQWNSVREQPKILSDSRATRDAQATALRYQQQELEQTQKAWQQWQDSQSQGLPSVWSAPKGLELAIAGALGAGLRAGRENHAGFYWLGMAVQATPPVFPTGVRPLWAVIQQADADFPDEWSPLVLPLRWTGLVEDSVDLHGLLPQLQAGQMLVNGTGAGVRWDGLAWSAEALAGDTQHWAQGRLITEQEAALEKAREALQIAEDALVQQDSAWQQALLVLEQEYRQAQQARDAAHQAWQRQEKIHMQWVQEQASAQAAQQKAQIALAAAEQAQESLNMRREENAMALRELEQILDAEQAKPLDTGIAERQQELQGLKRKSAQMHAQMIASQAVQESLLAAEKKRLQDLAHASAILDKNIERQDTLQARLDALTSGHDARKAKIEATRSQLDQAEIDWQRQDRERQQKASALQDALVARDGLQQNQHQLTLNTAGLKESLIRAEGEYAHKQQSRKNLHEMAQQTVGEPIGRLAKIHDFTPAQQAWTVAQAREALEGGERRIQALGEVNLRADIDAETKRQELETLRADNADVEDAIAQLRAAITQINQQGQARLKETFKSMNQLFSEHFQRLFSGGEARLIWIDDEDPLSPGIDIRARPPGKAMQSVYLLSGGEKALTALSMIAAVLRLCPTPICLLDEVDAALDDANVARFCALLSELGQGTQKMRFVIITHHRLSMAKADQLLGIGMPERGVSRLYAVDLLSQV